jgi:hypothetical protein
MSSIDVVQASKNLPEGFISKPIRLVARKEDFQTLTKMKLGERSDYILKHAQVLPRPKPKKKGKKRFRVYLDFTEEELAIIDKCAKWLCKTRSKHIKDSISCCMSDACTGAKKAISENGEK